jgi:hypothetical protein
VSTRNVHNSLELILLLQVSLLSPGKLLWASGNSSHGLVLYVVMHACYAYVWLGTLDLLPLAPSAYIEIHQRARVHGLKDPQNRTASVVASTNPKGMQLLHPKHSS